MAPTILTNARIFTCAPDSNNLLSGSIIFEDGVIQHVGPDDSESVVQARRSGAAHEIDVQNRVVTPGFIDGHVHILHFGLSLGRLDLLSCRSLEQIRASIKAWAVANPSHPRILCKGWLQSSTGGEALATTLDDLDPRPIYIDAMDLHSAWCNTAALDEVGVASMPDPPGGTIHRDNDGRPTGLLSETATLSIVMPYLTSVLTSEEKQAALQRAFAAYSEAGYTGLIDMAMDEDEWTALDAFRQGHQPRLPFHVAAYWLVPYGDSDQEIQHHLEKAVEMHQKFHPSTSPSFCITGIKLIADGTVDGCTAALSQPYGAKPDPEEPIWPADRLAQVVAQADAAGLQCAVHAIGDEAIKQAIEAFARLDKDPKGIRRRRHRIEHLELCSADDAKRLGELGIIASVQPVHSDPVLFRGWPSLIGSHRCQRAFAYREFLDAGAPLALGTDAPTARHLPLPNLYNATTRRSALEPLSTEMTNPHFAISLHAAVKAATVGVAYTRYAETWTGSLVEGMSADFVILDTNWTPEGLLQARVRETWYQGQKGFEAPS